MRRNTELRLQAIENLLERLQLLIMVMEPQVGTSADAYEGLRRQVIAGAAERTAHLSQLARLDAELQRSGSVDNLAMVLDDLLAESGVERVTVAAEEAFDVVGGKGDALETLEPAYVEPRTGRIVRTGKARLVETSAPNQSASAPSVDQVTAGESL